MADDILSKACTRCGIVKPLAEFYRAGKESDGRQDQCKACKSAFFKQRCYRYLRPFRPYYDRDKERARLARVLFPEKWKARGAVSHAVRDGKLPRAKALPCAHCGQPASSYHHHNGYSAEHALDVIPLCRPCHVKADA